MPGHQRPRRCEQLSADSPGIGSVTVTGLSVTLPALVTSVGVGDHHAGAEKLGVSDDLTTLISGAATAGTVTDDVAATGSPLGGVPVTVAVLTTWPASTSA